MGGISAIGGSTMNATQIASAYNTKMLVMEKDMAKMQGKMALQLINSASIDPAVGKNLNMTA